MNKNTRKCWICGRYNSDGVYYRVTITRARIKGSRKSYRRDEKVIKSWQVCGRHMLALKNMLDVVTHRRDDARKSDTSD